METQLSMGALSLVPVGLALILAFWTRDAVFSLLIGCMVGGVVAGMDPATGLAEIFQSALGTEDFVWVMMIEVFVGMMIAFYMRAGVIEAFSDWAGDRVHTRRRAKGFGWGLGLFVFFSDYFSPLFAGPIAKPLTDRHRVSREMLAYLLDSGSAPVATLLPFTAWAVYIGGLLQGYGPVESAQDGMGLFISSIPFNLYGWLAVVLSGAVAFGFAPLFGPMKEAERRAKEEGKVLRDGAVPLTGKEMDEIDPAPGKTPNLVLFLLAPVTIVLGVALGTFFATGSARILEAFIAAVLYQAVMLGFGGYFASVDDGIQTAVTGIKGVFPAIVILALAYSINEVSQTLGAQEFIVTSTEGWMSAGLVPVVTFLTGAFVSFFTGTSWGTYAILTPFVMPVAMNLSGGDLTVGVTATVGALVGGALFGDHCSPLSDTSVLSSFGAGSDHMDHVSTQLPYALTAGIASALVFAAIGLWVI